MMYRVEDPFVLLALIKLLIARGFDRSYVRNDKQVISSGVGFGNL